MTRPAPIPGSFRDPGGFVYEIDGRIYRSVHKSAGDDYKFVRDSGVLGKMVNRGWLVGSEEKNVPQLSDNRDDVAFIVEHPRLSFVSYPYEWSFAALKAAALFHLDFHLALLEDGVTLSDASAYNIQFQGTKPIFIDLLSLRPYRDGEYWVGHRQFCEQFLNPLLVNSSLDVAPNAWYRGSLEGITTNDLARILPIYKRIGWNAFVHVTLQASLQQKSLESGNKTTAKPKRKFPISSFRSMLQQMRKWIAKLETTGSKTTWSDYANTHSYASNENSAKRRFVAEFVEKSKPHQLWDVGCNTGDYSALALSAGASQVIGFDFDPTANSRAFTRAQATKLDFLPLILDAANPSPNQGWRQNERSGIQDRANADALLALAFEHHLAVGRNVPLPQVVEWLTGLAPTGVIEFVEKSDPTMQQMLALREDVFPDYNFPNFRDAITTMARIVKEETVSASGRRLVWYQKEAG